MNQKELNEIRRRFRPEHNSIHQIHGCYVNSNKEIIAGIDESLGLLTKEEAEKYFALLKKTLSGALGKNLLDISFATKQVMDSDEHRLLTALRKSELKDETVLQSFYRCIIDAVDMEDSNYLILIVHDAYDVPHRGKDGQLQDDSGDVFKYLLCCICPVKSGKPELGYSADESRFHSFAANQIVSAPALGFLFPTFDDRSANIYNALFYSHDANSIHQEFIDAVFKTEVPMSAGQQREAFHNALTEALAEECSYDLIQAVHEQLNERITLHKESKDPEPLRISAGEMSDILENSGMTPERIESFHAKCISEFGQDAELRPANIIDSKRFEICTPEVKVTVPPSMSYLVQTKVINGKKYILIPADAGVEVNGIGVSISEEETVNLR